ncbi:MAG TPA: Rne/Rng family ribonuclease [Propionibacteriaceae bacterium]|nr:Rne/Rng family ribonuclease [Propionibacteriaceae bacterium]
MLDLESDVTNETPQADGAPASPPRRRRAASRPAGPPKPVEAPIVPEPAPVMEPPHDPEPLLAEGTVEPAGVTETTSTHPDPEPLLSDRTEPAPSPSHDPEPLLAEGTVEAAGSTTTIQTHADPEPLLSEGDASEPVRRTRAPRTRAPRIRAPQAEALAHDIVSGVDDPHPPLTSSERHDLPTSVGEALEAVEAEVNRGRRTRTRRSTPAFVPDQSDVPVDAEAVLDSLAAAIASGASPDALAEQVEEVIEIIDIRALLDAAEVESDEVAAFADDADTDGETADDILRRRRRRRGGRRRRRSGEPAGEGEPLDAEDDASTHEVPDEPAFEAPVPDEPEDVEGDEVGVDGVRRRRRRRRRRGEDVGTAEDDPTEVVVRVREPRRTTRPSVSDEVTGIDGSTRMEAKRQRRKEGRAAGRRRAPILSESEFLARRESVQRKMVIRQNHEFTQLAVLEDNILVEHYVDRASATSLIGNVYLGRIQNVLPSMEAAFIDIGRGRNAVLYAGEVDWDSFGVTGDRRKVEQVFRSGQTVLVQVTKDPVGAKGARLTNHISLPGRYVVYSPGGHLSGISRKLAENERQRLKDILAELIADEASVIVRTAAEGASEAELVRDVNRLKAQWEAIEKKVKQGSAPQQLYAEPDPTVRIVRDLFTEDFSELVIAGNGQTNDAWDTIEAYVSHVAPHLRDRLTRWSTDDQGDPFGQYRIDDQIAKALERKVFLPSGGSLVIDRTEAMTVIDVNTGKFTGTGGNLEATVTSNNLEAAEEVVRQLRLRDIGGIIVVDFIDMVLPSNRELLLRRLVECLGRDRTRHQVAEVTSLGLVQLTRKKIGTGLAEAFTEPCEHCGGRGYARHEEPVDSQAPSDGGDRGERRGGGRGNPRGGRPEQPHHD